MSLDIFTLEPLQGRKKLHWSVFSALYIQSETGFCTRPAVLHVNSFSLHCRDFNTESNEVVIYFLFLFFFIYTRSLYGFLLTLPDSYFRYVGVFLGVFFDNTTNN